MNDYPIASDKSYEVALKRIRDKQFRAPQLSRENRERFLVEQPIPRMWDGEAEPAEPQLTVIDQVRR